MGSGDTVILTLVGGAPWGFRLQGGGHYPLQVSKIRKRSPAFVAGLHVNDTVVSINGAPLTGRSHDEAMHYVDTSGSNVKLEIFRDNMPSVHTVPGFNAAVIGGGGDGNAGTNVTSSSATHYDDGVTKGTVESQSFVHKVQGMESRGFVQKQEMTSSTAGIMVPGQPPLPSLLDTSISRQPYSSQPVQVQVSAMFGESSQSEMSKTQPHPMFNVRNVTTTTNTSSSAVFSQNGDVHNYSDSLMSPLLDDVKYPQFPLPAAKKWSPPSNNPKLPPVIAPKPRPLQEHVPIMQVPNMRVRDIKMEMLSPRSYDDNEDVDSITSSNIESNTSSKSQHRLPVFAPPVQISLHARERDDVSSRPHNLDLHRAMSIESEISSPTSSLGQRKLFSDSAFYNDPEKNFPTIQDQMKLCKLISHSLTSAANRKARGAKMFAKRQETSQRWVHDGKVIIHQSFLEDIPGYYNTDTEVNLQFKIPRVKHRVSSPDKPTKMSLSQAEFEHLRLDSQRCEHQGVSPNLCFDIAQSLKTSKGKAGTMFEKRKQRVEKYIIDETNAQKSPIRATPRLGKNLNRPLKGTLTPWEAAMVNSSGSVELAFDELTEFERKQKLNQMLKMRPAAPPPPVTVQAPRSITPPLVLPPNMEHSSLKSDPRHLLQGPNFNRKAKGWGVYSDASPNYTPQVSGTTSPNPMYGIQQQQQQQCHQQQQYYQPASVRNYNPKPKAWRASGDYEYQGYSSTCMSDSSNIMSPTGYHSSTSGFDLPGTDM